MFPRFLVYVILTTQLLAGTSGGLFFCVKPDGTICCVDFGPVHCECDDEKPHFAEKSSRCCGSSHKVCDVKIEESDSQEGICAEGCCSDRDHDELVVVAQTLLRRELNLVQIWAELILAPIGLEYSFEGVSREFQHCKFRRHISSGRFDCFSIPMRC